MSQEKPLESNENEKQTVKPRKNMHEGVEVWEDTCVCEAEPRWQALGEELEAQAKSKSVGESESSR